jgi:hypothetical protein
MLKVKSMSFEDKRFVLKESDPSGETYVVVRHARLNDEARRYAMIAPAEGEEIMVTQVAMIEMYLTLVECNILDENDEPLLVAGLSFPEFEERVTKLWAFMPNAVWEIQKYVHEANPQWSAAEGNG